MNLKLDHVEAANFRYSGCAVVLNKQGWATAGNYVFVVAEDAQFLAVVLTAQSVIGDAHVPGCCYVLVDVAKIPPPIPDNNIAFFMGSGHWHGILQLLRETGEIISIVSTGETMVWRDIVLTGDGFILREKKSAGADPVHTPLLTAAEVLTATATANGLHENGLYKSPAKIIMSIVAGIQAIGRKKTALAA